MERSESSAGRAAPFTEKSFYLGEFRGRTLAIAAPSAELREPSQLEAVLKELEANPTPVVIVSDRADRLHGLPGTPVIEAADASANLAGRVWHALRDAPRVGLALAAEPFAPGCRAVVEALRVTKLVWLDRDGGITGRAGARESVLDLPELSAWVARGLPGVSERRASMLREVEILLGGDLPAINLCALEGLADELFTYAGSGTLFTPRGYVAVRRLGLDDFDAAADLIRRGVAEGYLAPRAEEEVERVLASGIGAFLEGTHLAGIGALLVHPRSRAGEIVSLYTLTRFVGGGIGAELVRYALERARELSCVFAMACTTSERVAQFFEREGFRRVATDEIPDEKWRDYDPERRARALCLRIELR